MLDRRRGRLQKRGGKSLKQLKTYIIVVFCFASVWIPWLRVVDFLKLENSRWSDDDELKLVVTGLT